ncbi:MAG: peptidoglycan DD-metalloendopeptidase family protein [Oscillospiraceae bacterium]|nr:peptidoglycan DD-metalloendopeptidase family protein [Oscillospiraceae bacterium]
MNKRKTLIAVIALVLVFMMLFGLVIGALSMSAHAARSDELQEKLDELNERKQENAKLEDEVRQRLEENYDQVRALVEQKKELDERINGTRDKMAELTTQIEDMNKSIADKQAELDQSEAERAELNEKYKQRIRVMEENGTISYWSVLFQATGFADLLSRIDMINEIVTADQLMLDQMEALAAKIEQQRQALETEKQILEEKKQEMVELNLELESQRLESDSYIQQINTDIGLLSALRLEYQNIEAEIQEEIDTTKVEYNAAKAKEAAEAEAKRRREAAAAAARQATATSNAGSGKVDVSGFLFPLPAGIGVFVTDPFGNRYHPVDKVWKFHSGVDLAASSGTSVYASKAGTVYKADYGQVNGNYIKIRHADGTETFYLHLSAFSVKEGDYVTQGQKIGEVGSTGKSTGPHLHFQIMVNGSAVNPMDYISLQ